MDKKEQKEFFQALAPQIILLGWGWSEIIETEQASHEEDYPITQKGINYPEQSGEG
jgi:hypothetical protein